MSWPHGCLSNTARQVIVWLVLTSGPSVLTSTCFHANLMYVLISPTRVIFEPLTFYAESGRSQCHTQLTTVSPRSIDVIQRTQMCNQVLSVIAQQLLVLREGRLMGKPDINFMGVQIALKDHHVIITMNPGYAGRTELPDNLAVRSPCGEVVASFSRCAAYGSTPMLPKARHRNKLTKNSLSVDSKLDSKKYTSRTRS